MPRLIDYHTPITALTSRRTIGIVMSRTPMISMMIPERIIFVIGTIPIVLLLVKAVVGV